MPSTPNTGHFRELARANRRQLRSWPERAARIVHQVRNAQRQAALIEDVENEVHDLAHKRHLLVRVHREPDPPFDLVPEDARLDLLREVLGQPGFVRHLDQQARRMLREDNIQKRLFPERGLRLTDTFNGSSPLVLRGSTRFNVVEATFESMSVGLAAAIGNRFKATTAAPEQPEEFVLGAHETKRSSKRVSVLSWHCGIAGTLALVLDYVKPRDRYYEIVEADVFGGLRDRENFTHWSGRHRAVIVRTGNRFLRTTRPEEDFFEDETVTVVRSLAGPVVERRDYAGLAGPWRQFDRIVLDMPPPGEGVGAQLRNAFKTIEERQLFDPGRFGPKRWWATLMAYFSRLPHLLKADGEAVVIVPAGVRRAREYRFHAGLVEDVDDALEEFGMEVLDDIWVVEEDAIPQPYVGRARPERRVLIARRRS